MVLNINTKYPGQDVIYEIVLPSWSNPSLTRLLIDANTQLLIFNLQKEASITFGDSITHGTGQGVSTYKSYPYLLSTKLGLDNYNLGVGGSRTSILIAKMSVDIPQAKVITILIGINDLTTNKTTPQYQSDYREILTEIRKNHPSAHIFCISLIYTGSSGSSDCLIIPSVYRLALKNLIATMSIQDTKLHFIAGETITSAGNLATNDPLHLSVSGAAAFANQLFSIINPYL
jgi:lysophospholipase L1-like esterase